MARQMSAFVVAVRFGLKRDGFACECPQKVKKCQAICSDLKMCCENIYISDMVSRRVSFMISLHCYIANMGCLRANMGCLRANMDLSQR